MRVASIRPVPAARDAPVLQRAGTLLLVVAVHLLLLWLLLRVVAPPAMPTGRPLTPIRVDLIPAERTAAPTPKRAEQARRPPGGAPRRAAPPFARITPAPPPVPPPELSKPSIWSQVIPLTRQEMADSDLARMPSRPAAPSGEGTGRSGTSAGRDSGDAGPGTGPNGEPLYNADWQRRPTRAELAFYLPRSAPRTGWGMIACRTVAGYRVEDCREITESPAGSGFASAVRQAAWQFRVLPPRIGGRSLVGSWVRIRIEYTESGAE